MRFAVAIALALPLMHLAPALKRRASSGQLRLAFVPGLLVAALLLCQTEGLRRTSVANNSFITTLYVVMVPLLEATWRRRRVPARDWLLVLLALAGTALICGLAQSATLNVGDFLTLLAAFFGAVHILVVDALGDRVGSAFHFNVYQTLWAGLASLVAAVALEGPPHLASATWTWHSVAGLLFLVVACTLVGYALQVQSQRTLPPVVASLLFLLESPFATLFGWLILGEALGPMQAAGAALIFVAAVGAALSSGKASVDFGISEVPAKLESEA